jgi:hypothetical protein
METPTAAMYRPIAPESATKPHTGAAGQTILWGVFGVLALTSAFSANPLISPCAIIALPLLAFFLWRHGEAPVLLFACAFQWLQATAAIFYTNHFDISLNEAFGIENVTFASWLSIAAVLVLAFGIRCGFVGAGPSRGDDLAREAADLSVNRIGVVWFVSFVIAAGLDSIAFQLPSVTQPILAVASLKWVSVFLLCYTVIHHQRGYGILLLCIGLEFASGLLGAAFANFKSVFFVLVVATMSSPLALRGRRLYAAVACFVFLFIIGIMWSSIKMDYRAFLSEETSGQEDTVSVERKFDKLADLVESVTWDNVSVPGRLPYENGELWKGCIIHVLTPRFLFPDKPAVDDSERTRLYTGMQVAGMEAGTSIGIGYVGESYVDFGPVLMFAPIFLLGVLYGLINRFFITRTRYKLLGSAFAVAILVFNAYEIETSNIKLIGGVIAAALVGIVIYLTLAKSIMNYLRQTPVPIGWKRSFPNIPS